ncbi:MAG: hypothetical protein ABI654_14270 [Betaproteobacteria bacterium]
MATKRTVAKRKAPAPDGILLRYRDKDTPYGVTRGTTTRLADTLGLSETQVVHVALARLARQTLPRYELDNGPLTEAQKDAVDRLQPPGRGKVTKSLF